MRIQPTIINIVIISFCKKLNRSILLLMNFDYSVNNGDISSLTFKNNNLSSTDR